MPASAEEEAFRPEIEVGVHGGGHFFTDTNALGRGDNPVEGNALRHSGAVGARVGLGLGPHWMPEIELAVIPTQTQNGLADVTVLGWRAHISYHILTGRIRPFILAGGGALSSFSRNQDQSRDQTAGMFHAGAGIKFDVTKVFGFRLDGRILLPPEIKAVIAPDYEALLGLYVHFGLGKPPAPEPPKVVDADGDGILDAQDQCPTQAGLKENNGCPDKDSDGDTIVDRLDKCPAEAGIKENDGCPDKDADSDGVVDRLDKCPAEPGVKELEGCPDKDDDGDGVPNRLDKCPDKPETKNNYQDEDGCPDELPQAVKKFTGAIQGINFEVNQAVITQPSFKVLDKALQMLTEYPDVRIEIGGHTDTSGDAQKNRELSQQRADAVRQWFVSKGVADTRLKAMGYGPDKPLIDNKTPANRAKNRRVEFQLIAGS